MFSEPRIAIIHYWLVRMRGGERVLERLLSLFPRADIFTHVYDPKAVSETIRSRKVSTSFIQNLPGSRRHYQKYLPLMPMALEELDLNEYDFVISSESGPAKGVITNPDTPHLCYCHSPMRYLWDAYGEYKLASGNLTRLAMPWLFTGLRTWDTTSAARVDSFIANSNFVRKRIEKYYRRDSKVVFPPVHVEHFAPSDDVEPRYLWVGEMTPYKRPDLVVEAFNALRLPLMMVGDGPMAREIARKAGPTISIVPRLDYPNLREAYARSRALVFAAREDFGIVMAEALAAGRPVIAYGRGGSLDIVTPGVTGVFFDTQTPDAMVDAVERFEQWLPQFDPSEAVRRARRFAPERFDEGILAEVRNLTGWTRPARPHVTLVEA